LPQSDYRFPAVKTRRGHLITVRGEEGDWTRPRQVGADAYLTKPFDVGGMIRVVRKLTGAPPVTFS